MDREGKKQTKKAKKTMISAVVAGDIAGVQRLLDQGLDADTKNKQGMSLLYIASQNGHTEVADLLIDHGADVNALDNKGNTPLLIAAAINRSDIVQLLLERGADVNFNNNMGKTSLELAGTMSGVAEYVPGPPAGLASRTKELLKQHGGVG